MDPCRLSCGGMGLGVGAGDAPIFIGLLFAFLGGSAMLNILKEELPEERQSRFWAFLIGVAGYSAVLSLI